MHIYLAGSLFNEADRDYAKKVLRRMESKETRVYWPWRDAGDEELKRRFHGHMSKVSDEIVRRNLVAIRRSDIIVAISEGSDVESGTAMEIGYAHALGKQIYGLRTDFRTQGEGIGPTNIMVTRSMRRLFSDVEEMLDYLIDIKKRIVPKSGLRNFYSKVSGEYADSELHPVTNGIRAAEQAFTRGRLSGMAFSTALDLGCGPGGFLEHVHADTKIGVDLSSDMLKEHKKTLPGAKFITANIENRIPLPTASTDMIHCAFVLDHISNLAKFFSEVNRVLRGPQNLLLLSFHNRGMMVRYRREMGHFSFTARDGNTYDVYSAIPRASLIRTAFNDYFNLVAKETVSLTYNGAKVGFDYLVLGAKK